MVRLIEDLAGIQSNLCKSMARVAQYDCKFL